ncbi:MAG: FAD-dependent oxidoreductase, partial [Deltaproteobacteria bacterium]|nr:FAD-dependent oxidoreductase [Deltaproteobacteria bacterium]
MADADVVIVGAGPAGCATALFLAAAAPERRQRILVLDKARFPRDKVCAGAVGRRAEQLLATIGVHLGVSGVPIRGLSVVTPSGRQQARLGAGRIIGRVVRRIELDAALAQAVADRGVRLHQGVKVSGLAREPGAVLLQTSAGALRTRAVVGADGVGSTVRRALGLPRGRYFARASEEVTPERQPAAERELLHFDLRDPSLRGYRWAFPTELDGAPATSRGTYELLGPGSAA